jgi:hypothetical protein
VVLSGSNKFLPRLENVDRDLVANCSDEGFDATSCGIRAREEAGEKELRQTATPGDVILSDGKFSSSSGTVEPENVERRSDHPPYSMPIITAVRVFVGLSMSLAS